MQDRAPSSIQVISRAAAVLRVCAHETGGLSLGQIAERVALPRSTVQRIVAALAAEGLLSAGTDSHSIRLGPEIHALAEAGRIDIVALAHPHLLQLSERVEETVDLAVLRRGHMVFIDQIAGPQRLRAVSAVGQKFPLHCTANGKAALALLEDEQIDRVLERSLERHTPATITDPVVLRQELGLIRQTGIAFDREEHSPGICAVGAAFRDPMAMTYAIAVPMPSIRFEETRAHVAQSVLDCAYAVLADVRRASAKSV